MNLLDLSSELSVSADELERILKEKNIRVFSRTFTLSDQLIDIIKNELEVNEPDAESEENDFAADEPGTVYEENETAVDEEYEGLKSILGEINQAIAKSKTPPRKKASVQLMESCVKDDFHIIVDTCSIIRAGDAFKKFYDYARPLLEKYDKKILVSVSVIAELGKIIGRNNPETHKIAQENLNLIRDEVNAGNIQIIGSKDDMVRQADGREDYFADTDFMSRILDWRNNNENVLFITQDHTMTLDINAMNEIKCIRSESVIIVRKLDRYGNLVNAVDDKKED